MPGNLPPSIQEQETLFGVTGISRVFSHNLSGFLAPNETFPVGLTKYISLIIGIKIDPNAEETSSENTSSGNGANIRSMRSQIKGMRGVDGRYPNKTSPTNIISSPIMLNVHGAHVSHFPEEEFGNVNELEGDIDAHANLKNSIVEFHVFMGKA